MKKIVSVALSLIIMITSTLCAQSMGALSTSMAGTMLSGKDLQALNELSTGGEIEFSEPVSSSQISSEPSSSSEVSSSQPSSSSKPRSSSSKPSSSSGKPVASSSTVTSSTPQTGDIYQTTIMGTNVATAEQMATYLLRTEYNPKINGTVWDLVTYYLNEGAAEGVRGDIAFCQSIHETGWFRYTGSVKPYQNNYCGLGSTANGVTGSVFPSPQIGVRAQIQHLKGYGTTDQRFVHQIVDPRYENLKNPNDYRIGIAPLWINLSGKWAYPGYDYIIAYPVSIYGPIEEGRGLAAAIADHKDYGSSIIKKYLSLINTTVDPELVKRAKEVPFSYPAP